MKLFDTTNHRIIGRSLAGIFALAVMPSTGGESASYSSTFNVGDLLHKFGARVEDAVDHVRHEHRVDARRRRLSRDPREDLLVA